MITQSTNVPHTALVKITHYVFNLNEGMDEKKQAKMTKLSQDLLRLQNQLQEFKSGSAETMITTNVGRFALNKSSGDYVIRPSSSGLSKATIECLRLFFSDLEGDHISTKSGDFLNSRCTTLIIHSLYFQSLLYSC
ncbi:hypothetical protein IFM89_029386 [Coptis chinensis]|uniref:Uncharacterized protein n=1 Tax=Coptis chinensis TaxID=261450 RepID=A0A835MA61_9MAGN|nr:hypothetical protein IFM89_029386 [Coptis chinensis]